MLLAGDSEGLDAWTQADRQVRAEDEIKIRSTADVRLAVRTATRRVRETHILESGRLQSTKGTVAKVLDDEVKIGTFQTRSAEDASVDAR